MRYSLLGPDPDPYMVHVSGLRPSFGTAHLRVVREATSSYGASERETHESPRRVPEPFDDAEALEELGDAIATLAAHIHAATHRLLLLVAEFDRRRGWELGGHRSCAHWLAARCGIDLGAAREKVRAARVLVELPETSAAMARGELSFSQVRALTRIATPENEDDLLPFALGSTTAQLERMVRGWRAGTRLDELAREEARHRCRTFSIRPADDGMYVVSGRLQPEVGALVMRAIESAGDHLFDENGWRPADDPKAQELAAQRRADALALIVERAMQVGFGGGRQGRTESSAADGESRMADAAAAEGSPVPISGTRAERYMVVLHGDAQTLSADCEPGRSELDDGTRVSAETFRRLACDTGLVVMAHDGDSSVLSVGRKTRTIPPALRRALEYRDKGCRFPGCGLRFADAHHVRHWGDGGETSLGNCVLLCKHHHRLVHEGRWRVGWWGEGRAVFYDPHGGTHFDGRWEPPAPRNGEPRDLAAALVDQQERNGIRPDGWTSAARWKRESDIPRSVLLDAIEAMAG